jgi:multisubunit Na+/H+ antiporter MnhB subunit
MKILNLKTATYTVIGLALALSLSFLVFGAAAPGGGFASGIMLASAYLVTLLTVGQQRTAEYCPIKRLLDITATGLGLLIFLSLLGASRFGGGSFLNNPFAASKLLSAAVLNTAIAITFGAGISCIITVFLSYESEGDAK